MGTYHGVTREILDTRDLPAEAFFARYNYTSTPVLVQWMATYRCSLACPHCLCGGGVADTELSLAVVERLLDQVASMKVREFLVTGGEPVEREDLPEVVNAMHKRSIRWSLNTAAYPPAPVRRAMKAHPPAFVAVSLDGPEEFHDSFRGRRGAYRDSLDAIAFYREITRGHVAAGTTLNARNFGYLAETFGIVLESGATSWGIHLTFPEGRATGKRELFLSKKQLKKVLSFVAAKRKYFPVMLADEIGYCGEWGPMVRDVPFFCGAGRVQCVILPDGEVVPCSTVDKSESAGNIRQRPLEEIWRDGFASVRGYKPEGKCESCRYAPACWGGCWLQRRHGRHCFRDVWHAPRALASAASLAVCLGLASPVTTAFAQEEPPVQPAAPEEKKEPEKPAEREKEAPKPDELEEALIQWCLHEINRDSPWKPGQWERFLKERDPAGMYFLDITGNLHKKESREKLRNAQSVREETERRLKRVQSVLKTKYRSLALVSFLWQDIARCCLDGKKPAERTDEERKLLRETLQALEKTAAAWRQEIFEKKLDAFLQPKMHQKWANAMRSKSMRAGQMAAREKSIRQEHWGSPETSRNSLEKGDPGITKEFLAKHPLGETMRLAFETSEDSGLKRVNSAGTAEVKQKDHLDIFDVFLVPKTEGEEHVTLTFDAGGAKMTVKLPAGTELLYGDVLRLAYAQKNAAMDKMVRDAAAKNKLPGPEPLFIPAVEAYIEKIAPDKSINANGKQLLKWLLLNTWMF